MPLSVLPTLAKLNDGEFAVLPTATGVQVILVASSRLQPVDQMRAAPAIEQFLLNERKRQVLADDLKSLRSVAQIGYVGKFAGSAPPAPEAVGAVTAAEVAASAAAASTADAASSPASGVDAATIGKGLGLK